MFNSKLTSLLLIGFCAILGNLIYYQTKPEPIVELETDVQGNLSALENNPFQQSQTLDELSQYEEITLRPLFSQSRQLESEETSPVVTEKKQTKKKNPLNRNTNLILRGIVFDGKEKMALIKGRRDTKANRLKIDEEINGWTLTEINNDSVRLESSGQDISLEMSRKADPKLVQKRRVSSAQNLTDLPVSLPTQNPVTKPRKPNDRDIRDRNPEGVSKDLPSEFYND